MKKAVALELMKKFRKLSFWHRICSWVDCVAAALVVGVFMYCEYTGFSNAAAAEKTALLLGFVIMYIANSKHDEVVKEILSVENIE